MYPPSKHRKAFQLGKRAFPALPSSRTTASEPPQVKAQKGTKANPRAPKRGLDSHTISSNLYSTPSSWSAMSPVPQPLQSQNPVENTCDKLPPLLCLPVEIHKDIIDLLPTNDLSLLSLRLVNNYFHTLLPAPTHASCLAVEQGPHLWNRFLTCRYCIRLRPVSKFADSMLRGRTGVYGKAPQKRFCVDCGFAKVKGESRYSPGTEVVVDGVRKVWCVTCGVIRTGVEARGCTGCCAGCHWAKKCGCEGLGELPGSEGLKAKEKKRRGGRNYNGRNAFRNYGYEDWEDGLEEYDEAFWESYD